VWEREGKIVCLSVVQGGSVNEAAQIALSRPCLPAWPRGKAGGRKGHRRTHVADSVDRRGGGALVAEREDGVVGERPQIQHVHPDPGDVVGVGVEGLELVLWGGREREGSGWTAAGQEARWSGPKQGRPSAAAERQDDRPMARSGGAERALSNK
jgi:hypothetical protein